MKTAALFIVLILAGPVFADEVEDGQVQIPLDLYNQLVNASRVPVEVPASAPAAFALGTATVNVTVASEEPKATGQVQVLLAVEVLEDGWTAVPVLSAGTPVEQVSVNGSPAQLIATAGGLVWGTQKKGTYTMDLRYRVDASRFEQGFVLALPVPAAAAINLKADLPGTGLDAAVIPSAGTTVLPTGARTRVTATVPTTQGLQLSWRTPSTRGHSVGRATYSGRLEGEAVAWTGSFLVEVFNDETVTLQLMPRSATLRQLEVDGKEAPILIEDNHFATLVGGRGRHTVTVNFQVPVKRGNGPPKVDLTIPQVPVSRFDLSLPGKKDVTVTPAGNVSSRVRDGETVATVFVPLGNNVSFTWAEAVPEAIKAEVRSNAAIYHAVMAEEGVLDVHAMVVLEVTRGATSVVKLELPPEVQVNRISSPSGAVSDWRINKITGSTGLELAVFLDRKLEGELRLHVHYDRSLAKAAQVQVPLIRATDAQRQRGMVALLASKDLTLRPTTDEGLNRVGENQLPAFVRDTIERTVAHTFKYVELPEQLVVEAVPPERKHGRFDAQVDTLVSLGEVTLRGAASVEINVKSGGIMEMEMALPQGVNLLSLAAPSLRTHKVEPGSGEQLIAVSFTQEMEGLFRIELAYEKIMVDGDAAVKVPRVSVRGADVEQGRLAVEALSAVEVQPTATEQLQALDIAELPRQLLLRTTNPILLAYKYVKAETPSRLALTLTRHRVVEVQEAAIDSAQYTTLFTRDGLAVTTARFEVRNSRKQFLRLVLPEGAAVWSATVDGKPEKPALGEGDEEGSVLIKIVTSTQGFPVQLIYASDGAKVRGLGKVKSWLPRPDILVTQSRWDVYLPTDMSYSEANTNMNLVLSGARESLDGVDRAMAEVREEGGAAQTVQPLQISVPATGVHYAFDKLYANQSDEPAWFSITYASTVGARTGTGASLVATLLLWLGVVSLLGWHPVVGRRSAIVCVVLGALVIALAAVLYRVGLGPAVAVSVLAAVSLSAWRGWQWWQQKLQPV